MGQSLINLNYHALMVMSSSMVDSTFLMRVLLGTLKLLRVGVGKGAREHSSRIGQNTGYYEQQSVGGLLDLHFRSNQSTGQWGHVNCVVG